jgi:mono/diheme cytochrome c family protein
MGDLANYVLSLARKPAWEMSAQELEDFYREQSARAKADPATWGRYLVRSAGCADCHTPLKPDGNPDGELMFAGGQEWSLGPYGTMVSYNLTSDSATGLGGWTDEQIKSVLTTGVRPDGSRMLPFPMPWTGYGNWKPEDLNAIVAYLRTIPPVSNRIPPPKDRNIIAYLVGKFRMLILKEDLAAQVRPGNAGTRATAGGAVGIQNVHGKEASE